MFSGNVRFNTSLEYFVVRIILVLLSSKTYFKYALEIKFVNVWVAKGPKSRYFPQISSKMGHIFKSCNKCDLLLATHTFANWWFQKWQWYLNLKIKTSFVLRNLLGMFPEKMSKYSPLHCSAWFVQLMMGFHTFFGHITT